MSVHVSSLVWKKSRHSGSALLLLLFLADKSHDDGGSIWPSVESMALNVRMSGRNVRYLLKDLIDSGELIIEKLGGGRNNPTRYKICLSALNKNEQVQAVNSEVGFTENFAQFSDKPGKPAHETRKTSVLNTATAIAAEPLEPSYKHPIKGVSGDRATPDEIWNALCRIARFNLKPTDRMRISGESMSLIGTAVVTPDELEAIVRFYALPEDSKHPEAKNRSRKLVTMLRELAEQAAIAMRVCPVKRTRQQPREMPVTLQQTDEEFTSTRSTVRSRLEQLRAELHNTKPTDNVVEMPVQRKGRHARWRDQHPKPERVDDEKTGVGKFTQSAR